jgi:hypothetical protein
MGLWILIIIITGDKKAFVSSIEFSNKFNCEAALAMVKVPENYLDTKVCVKK